MNNRQTKKMVDWTGQNLCEILRVRKEHSIDPLNHKVQKQCVL